MTIIRLGQLIVLPDDLAGFDEDGEDMVQFAISVNLRRPGLYSVNQGLTPGFRELHHDGHWELRVSTRDEDEEQILGYRWELGNAMAHARRLINTLTVYGRTFQQWREELGDVPTET